ncbi:transposase [Rhodococcus wratislaviensis]|uniref:transposase n=1 Tax=Rhodococcus wratislaviensis TaxID=44752 RepID=UPI0035155EC7
MVDAQAVKGADTVGTDTRGWDGGKRVNGRKRHVVTDSLGLLVVVLVTAASVQDRDGGRLALSRAKTVMPSMVLVWADGGYAGRLVAWVAEHCRMTLDIVRKPKGKVGFSVLPHRWLIERTLAWIVRGRRLDHDYERLPAHSEAMITPLAVDPRGVTLSEHFLRLRPIAVTTAARKNDHRLVRAMDSILPLNSV